MANALQIYQNEEFGTIRSVIINNEAYFVGKDIADALGYAQTSNMIKRIDSEDFKSSILDGMNMKSIIINESGLYSAILGSKLRSARKFKHWVTSEVLPSIRKNGGYMNNQENLSPEQIVANALLVANNIIANKDKQIEQMKPKVLFADAVSASKASILVGEMAKLLKQNGVDIGQKRFFEYLRQNGYLIKAGCSKNMPTQKAMELKLFEIVERTINNPDGSVRITKTTKVTGKGQVYFVNKLVAGVV